MTKLINEPAHCVDEMLSGLVLANPSLLRDGDGTMREFFPS